MLVEPFEGRIGRTLAESEGWWPPLPTGPSGAPNVVIVLLDDVGYAQFGAYGSDIATPTFDRLASHGLRYANFHTTALCSPTRACLLTGRNHHSNGMARVVELASGFPGYNATTPKENGFLSEILRTRGYATFAVGKWHLTPATQMSAGSPRDKWPLGGWCLSRGHAPIAPWGSIRVRVPDLRELHRCSSRGGGTHDTGCGEQTR
jgi:arylsulfatase